MIVQLEEAKHELTGMRPDIEDLGQALRVEFLAAKAEELEQETLAPDFWSNSTNSSKILQTIKQYKDTVDGYNALVARLEDAIALCEMSIEENDESSLEEIQAELEAIKNEAEHKRIEVDALRIISSCLVSGDGLTAHSDPFRVESGERNLNFDLGYVLKDGESIPEAILVEGEGRDWTIHNALNTETVW